MDRVKAGRRGLEDFCVAEYPRLVRMLSLYCGGRETAEDLAQETLTRVWRRWDHVGDLEAPDLWARRVALNLVRSWARHQRLARRASWRPWPAPTTVELAEPSGILALVVALPPRQREALILRHYEDRSVAETARLMGVREGTVRALSSQAVAALRDQGAAVAAQSDV